MPPAALVRHPAAPCPALRSIEATVRRRPAGRVEVVFFLAGDIERLRVAPRAAAPRFADGLWRRTCCELFVARNGEAAYREFNFSPSGEWAAYEFARYREGEPLRIPDPGIVTKRNPSLLELSARVPLDDGGPLEVGLSAVVEDERGALSYWALRHAAGKPDFHRRETFAMALE